VKFFHHEQPPKLDEQNSPYYVLDIHEITGEIDKRVARMKK
jgi:hypothetical protein